MKTVGLDVISVGGVGKANLIPYSEGKVVRLALDKVLVVPDCRCDLHILKYPDRSSKYCAGKDYVVYLVDGNLKVSVDGGLDRYSAYRTTRGFLQDDDRPPPKRSDCEQHA